MINIAINCKWILHEYELWIIDKKRPALISVNVFLYLGSLLAFIALSAAQSSAQTHINSAIVVINTSNGAWHSQVHWLISPYLAIKASNDIYQ